MKYIKRGLSILTFSIPVDVLAIGSIVKGITPTNAGAMLFGMVILLVGGLYTYFGASKENRIPLGVMVVGAVICICSFIALIIGLCLVAAPLSYIGGKKLWISSNLRK